MPAKTKSKASKAKSKKKREQHLHFKITGGSMTEIMRDVVRDGDWEKAVVMFRESMVGMSDEHIFSVLDGSMRLVGNEHGMDLKPDDTKERDEYLESVNIQHAGKIYHKGEWFRPYAVVLGYCRKDIVMLHDDKMRSPRLSFAGTTLDSPVRAYWYADNRDADVCVVLDVKHDGFTLPHAVLFKKCTSPPIWMHKDFLCVSRKPQVALEEFMTCHKLDCRGGHTYNDLDEKDDEADVVPSLTSLESIKADIASNMKEALPDVSTERLENVVDTVLGVEEEDVEPCAMSVESSLEGYILPNGKFYGCRYMEHSDLARRILKFRFNNEDEEDPQLYAEEHGWVRISSALADDKVYVRTGIKNDRYIRLSNDQQATLLDWCVAHGEKYPKGEEFGSEE